MDVRKAATSDTRDSLAYIPRRIALIAPQGESVYEFAISGRDRIGMLKDMSAVFAKHYVTLTSVDVDTTATGEFVMVVYADFRNADVNAKQVEKMLGAVRSIKRVVMGRASDVLFERFMFPITAGGSNRAIILPASSLAGYEKAVIGKGGRQGEEHLLATGRPVGLGVASTIKSHMPWADSNALLDAAVDAMRAMGWGLCSFDLSKMKEGLVSVSIRNPMFSGLTEAPVSWLLIGVVSGALEDLAPFPNRLRGRPTASKESITFELEGTHASPSVPAERKVRSRK